METDSNIVLFETDLKLVNKEGKEKGRTAKHDWASLHLTWHTYWDLLLLLAPIFPRWGDIFLESACC